MLSPIFKLETSIALFINLPAFITWPIELIILYVFVVFVDN